jgi:hypothetical protein
MSRCVDVLTRKAASRQSKPIFKIGSQADLDKWSETQQNIGFLRWDNLIVQRLLIVKCANCVQKTRGRKNRTNGTQLQAAPS